MDNEIAASEEASMSFDVIQIDTLDAFRQFSQPRRAIGSIREAQTMPCGRETGDQLTGDAARSASDRDAEVGEHDEDSILQRKE